MYSRLVVARAVQENSIKTKTNPHLCVIKCADVCYNSVTAPVESYVRLSF